MADIIYQYGEERHSRQIARQIVNNRPIDDTAALARIVAAAWFIKGGENLSNKLTVHPATRTFQALRIAVNNELDNLGIS